MAQQTSADPNGTVNSHRTATASNDSGESDGLSATSRKILDCCVGHPGETLRDAGGTLVSVSEPSMTIFDVLVDAKFTDTPRVVDSRSLGQYDIEELGFHGIESLDDGSTMTTFSAEYDGYRYGLRIIVSDGDETEGNQGESQ